MTARASTQNIGVAASHTEQRVNKGWRGESWGRRAFGVGGGCADPEGAETVQVSHISFYNLKEKDPAHVLLLESSKTGQMKCDRQKPITNDSGC